MSDESRQHGSSQSDSDRHSGNDSESRSERESLERREYTDENGQVHHHTRTFMEQHDESGKRGQSGSEDRGSEDRGKGGRSSEAQR